MLVLGRLHLQGLGVIQDFVEAHKWLNLAASRGEAAAVRRSCAVLRRPISPAPAGERRRCSCLGRVTIGGGQSNVIPIDCHALSESDNIDA